MAKIEYEIRGQVAYITLNRPDVRNALDREMVGTLHELWQEFQSSGSARVAVLTGAGGHFCAGYDVKAINSRQDAGIPFEWSRSSMFGDKRIGPDGHGVTKPIIAAFEEQNPGIKVEMQSVPQGYDDKVLTAHAAGDTPD